MADRYISEKALIDNIAKIEDLRSLSTKTVGIAISATPTADVEEVRHGEWKLMDTEKFMDGSYSSKFFCSKCLREIGVCHEHKNDNLKYAKLMYPYCHCGAKMDGGEEG